MKLQLVPLLFLAATTALAQTPSNSVPATEGASSGTASSYGAYGPASSNSGEVATPSTPSPAGGPVSLPSIQDRFSQLDMNHDGFLSAEEINLISRKDRISSSAARFDQMDTNHDGKISAAEYSAVLTAMEAGAIKSNPLSFTPPAAPGSAPTGATTPSPN